MTEKKATNPTSRTGGALAEARAPMTPEERGTRLKTWLKKTVGIKITDFAVVVDIHPATLARYFSGKKDVATVDQATAEKLLTGMGISDSKAWELLDIPEEHRSTFRSFRPPPLGSGPDVYRTVNETLTEPLFGEVIVPAGMGMELEPDNLDQGIQIIQLEDGRFHAVKANTMPAKVKRRLGRLVTISFSARST